MPYYLGKVFIELKNNYPMDIEYNLIEAENEAVAQSKLNSFSNERVSNWKQNKEYKNAQLKGAFIKKTL